MAIPNPEPEALRNLIINYIPTTVDEGQLRQLFEAYGPIESVKIVVNRENKQSRGFGFVKYQYAMSAMQAMNYLNGYPLMNKRLKVAYAKPDQAQQCIAYSMDPAFMMYRGRGGGVAPRGGFGMGGIPQGMTPPAQPQPPQQ